MKSINGAFCKHIEWPQIGVVATPRYLLLDKTKNLVSEYHHVKTTFVKNVN